tara:strand:- start:1167 stop:1400 length:234 start_codon:yes stop_codon:yes gene_type:complete
MGRKNQWEIERDKADALREKSMKGLTEDQLKAINRTYKAIDHALHNIREMEDLYLSDIRNLDNAFWKLKYQFNLGEK